MRLKINWKFILFIIVIIHIQHVFMLLFEILGVGNTQKIKDFILEYNPLHIEFVMIWFLPSSLLSLFIIPLFVYLNTKKNILKFSKSLLLYLLLIIVFYCIGFILMIFFEIKETNRYLLYPTPLSLEKHIIFWGYLIGNLTFALFFIPLWHNLKKFFIKEI